MERTIRALPRPRASRRFAAILRGFVLTRADLVVLVCDRFVRLSFAWALARPAFLTSRRDSLVVGGFALVWERTTRAARVLRLFLFAAPEPLILVWTRERRAADLETGRVGFRFVPTDPRFMKLCAETKARTHRVQCEIPIPWEYFLRQGPVPSCL